LPAAFKGSIACGVQRFNCLRRSKVQLPAAFKGSIPAAFKGSKGFRFEEFEEFEGFGFWDLVLGIWDLEFSF
jgi:hypothetical protein